MEDDRIDNDGQRQTMTDYDGVASGEPQRIIYFSNLTEFLSSIFSILLRLSQEVLFSSSFSRFFFLEISVQFEMIFKIYFLVLVPIAPTTPKPAPTTPGKKKLH